MQAIRYFCLAVFGLSIIAAVSCDPFIPEFPEGNIEGMRPVYADSTTFQIEKQSGRSINLAGKIYYYQGYLMINEVGQGIHVIDNSDKSNPQVLFFISIPGNTDVAIRDGMLYVNNHADLVTLRIDNEEIVLVDRQESLFLEPEQFKYPLGRDIYFECPDESKGRIIGWVPDILTSPECYKR
ncbi:MAG: hypothetical protein JXR10_02660 [Cyclobacteriaceae bacterium]